MRLSKFEKLMLINAQPIKFWLNIVGGLIALYLLWGCVSCLEGRSVRSTERSEARKGAAPLGATP